ncbi:MAG: site-2 protease family protein [Erythrobacter sp.]
MSETLILAAILIPCLIIAIVFHEVAHGWAALALGDPTAKERNRLSFNPLRHVDPIGTILVPGFLALVSGPIFGWAKPVPVLKNRLHNPRFGMMAVAAAGPGMNFVLAAIGAVILGLSWDHIGVIGAGEEPGWLVQGLTYFILINVFLGVFNLLPIPPFDGSHILEGLLPAPLRKHFSKLQKLGMGLIFGLIALTWFLPELRIFENTVLPPVEWAMGYYMGLAEAIAG